MRDTPYEPVTTPHDPDLHVSTHNVDINTIRNLIQRQCGLLRICWTVGIVVANVNVLLMVRLNTAQHVNVLLMVRVNTTRHAHV
jgi:hypothetical protein